MVDGRSAGHFPTAALRAEQEAAARWVEAFAASGYGPHGGSRLVDGPEPVWLRSPAVALAEVSATPGIAPYQDLAARLLRHAGDGATTGLLLAARLVRLALTSPAGARAFTQGYPLARRQTLATLAGLARPGTPASALAASAHQDPGWAVRVLSGLPRDGALDLDAIEVLADDGPEPRWLDGVPLDPQRPPSSEGPRRILLLTAPWHVTTRTNAAWGSPPGALAAEQALRRRAADHLATLSVGAVACTSSLDDGLVDLLQDRGVAVATDVALSRLRRLATATGARPVARLEDAAATDVGAAAFTRRRRPRRDWLVQGAGPSRTLAMPAVNSAARAAAVEAGERLLRAAGVVLVDPRVLPGAGTWQREAAASLRRAADAAPARTPFALHAAAEALASLDADLRANAAGQPSREVVDAYACVRLAVGSAFDLAHALLRVDARHARRASSPAGLRGGLGKAGSPKGIPGDLPPLM